MPQPTISAGARRRAQNDLDTSLAAFHTSRWGKQRRALMQVARTGSMSADVAAEAGIQPQKLTKRILGDDLAWMQAIMEKNNMSEQQILTAILTELKAIRELLAAGATAAADTTTDNDVNGKFSAIQLLTTIDKGKTYYKITGGAYTKHGVLIWPEALQAAGIDPDELDPRQPLDLAGWTAHYSELNENGYPRKITNLTPPADTANDNDDAGIYTKGTKVIVTGNSGEREGTIQFDNGQDILSVLIGNQSYSISRERVRTA